MNKIQNMILHQIRYKKVKNNGSKIGNRMKKYGFK